MSRLKRTSQERKSKKYDYSTSELFKFLKLKPNFCAFLHRIIFNLVIPVTDCIGMQLTYNAKLFIKKAYSSQKIRKKKHDGVDKDCVFEIWI